MNPQAWWGVALAALLAAGSGAPDAGTETPPAMERYTLVFLTRPANGGTSVADPEGLQRQHIAEAMTKGKR
jgi:hypothetical protein